MTWFLFLFISSNENTPILQKKEQPKIREACDKKFHFKNK